MNYRLIFPSFLAAIACWSSTHAQALQPPGESPAARIEFLARLADEVRAEALKDRERYYLGGLNDTSAEVREFAASQLGGNEYVPAMIRALATDPEPRVRQAVAMSLSNWITDNGVETCTAVDEVVSHLSQLLLGLEDDATAQYVVEVLGGRYSGEKPLACCMPSESKQRVREALRRLVETPPKHTIASVWGSSFPTEALQNIGQCKP